MLVSGCETLDVSAPGEFTAYGAEASAAIVLTPPLTITPIATLTITPTPVTVAAGAKQQFVVTGRDIRGNTIRVTPTWSVVGAGTITPAGLFTAGYTSGSYTSAIRASSNGKTASATVVVPPATPATMLADDYDRSDEADLTLGPDVPGGVSLGYLTDNGLNGPHAPWHLVGGAARPVVGSGGQTTEIYYHGVTSPNLDVRWTVDSIGGENKYVTFIFRFSADDLFRMYYVQQWIGPDYHKLEMHYADYTNELPPPMGSRSSITSQNLMPSR